MYCGYLEGYASKYLMRWRVSPTPLKDIEKSIHITTRLLERHLYEGRKARPNGEDFGIPKMLFVDFINENGITNATDQRILGLLGRWVHKGHLEEAIQRLNELLPAAKKLQEVRDAPSGGEDRRVDNTGQQNTRGYVHEEEDDGR